MNINYFGAQRVMSLAKECKKLKIFTQISTAYVNCNRKGGRVDEIIYEDDGRDVDEIVRNIMKMSIEEVQEKQSELLGSFPNTYTFAKNLSEKNIKKHQGDVKVVIWRPAIIAGSLEQPFKGWQDTF